MAPTDVEIRWVSNDNVYDLFVDGRFKNFFRTFSEAAIEADRIIHNHDILRQWKSLPPKKGKVRA